MSTKGERQTGSKDPLAGKIWWIVGASEGLGRSLAVQLDQLGAHLVLSARNQTRLEALCSTLQNAVAVPMDVTDPRSVARVTDQLGVPDAIVYCAGAYEPMSAPKWQPEQAEAQAEVNFVGALRVLSRIVPGMADRGHGRVVLIGSLAGFRGLPGAIGYGASKAALMHLAENLKADLAGTNVCVQLINPGFIRTRLTQKNDFDMPQLMAPDDAARRTIHAIRSGRFSTSFPAPFSMLFTLGRFLPLSLFQRVFR